MRAYDIIKKKRDGGSLTKEELSFLIGNYLSSKIPDYQISAFLMSVFFRGMTEEETVTLTDIMLHSGVVLDLSDIPGPKIDKHSTGGVGDKVSIILAPLLAAAGVIVPMISGRGLGHTGGTLDKLESIPGFRTDLFLGEFKSILKRIGVSMIGQTEEITPADKRLYALRDVTATVDCLPLIASSIMSKKLAEGIDGLVLDVKTGSGAFMKSIEDARKLAEAMVRIGNSAGVKTIAIITDMDQPLGKTVGNSLEIKECISALRGKWPEDLKEVTLTIGAWMLEIAKMVRSDERAKISIESCKEKLLGVINRGEAFAKFVELIDAHYGDPEVAFKPNLLSLAKKVHQIKIDKEGYIQKMDAEKVGIASLLIGAGRQRVEDRIDHSAGIILNKKVGDLISTGDTIAMFHYNEESHFKEAEELFLSAIEIGDRKPEKRNLILDIIQ